jgi:hypothetical protein
VEKALFLDVENKVWNVGKLKIPVLENIPMKDLKWFRDKTIEIESLRESNKLTVKKGVEFDNEWWNKTCQIGLGKTMDQVLESGISEPKFRALMAEVFYFLQNFGTIEEAKQSGIYDQKTTTSEGKQ